MPNTDLQQLFFQHIKSLVPANISFVETIADLLNISTDSAYRRIRGEKQISLEEIQKLSTHYKVSLDYLMNLNSNSIVFFGNVVDHDNFSFESYLKGMVDNIRRIKSANEKMLYYEAKDLPIFYFFQFKELAAFKYFFWMKTILSYREYNKMQFEDNDIMGILQGPGLELIKTYNEVPSVEIWGAESVNATIRHDAVIATLDAPGDRVQVARGGDGGIGNKAFKSSTHRAPRETIPGAAGEGAWITLELRLAVDMALVGLPNSGKSALLKALTGAAAVVASYPHDVTAFTQGLQWLDGRLFESTGIVGTSGIREVELVTGRVIRKQDLEAPHFGEGMVIFGEKLYEITWTTEKAFVYDWKTFKRTGEFKYDGEGWGLTTDGTSLIMSNGTSKRRWNARQF